MYLSVCGGVFVCVCVCIVKSIACVDNIPSMTAHDTYGYMWFGGGGGGKAALRVVAPLSRLPGPSSTYALLHRANVYWKPPTPLTSQWTQLRCMQEDT